MKLLPYIALGIVLDLLAAGLFVLWWKRNVPRTEDDDGTDF